jgi:hypothetical protein
MKRALTVLALVCSLVTPVIAFGQAGNASVGGFVQDATQAVIPGVTVTATNTQTGVVSRTITNETGTYTILSLLPGTYRLSAELPGFRPHVYNDVQLGTGVSARYNFTLQVGEVTQGIEVTADSVALLAESSATIGQVLPENQVRDLPLVGNDVLDLMRVMGGVRGGTGSEATTFAGISASMVNTTRDGLSVQDGRYLNGVFGTTVINPEMVGEMRVILTPVDAEMGRGNGQIQIATKSGTNRFTGSGVWSVANSALDANTWGNNNDIVNGTWQPTKPNWFNRNEYTVSYGGPVVRNKTFFFALWEQRIENQRTTQRPVILTDCARNGIFRYFDGWVNGNANTTTSATGASPTRAVVDTSGNPLRPSTNPGSNQNPNTNPFTGQLRHFSVFGPLANTPTRPDCSDAVLAGGSWDPMRVAPDSTGFIRKYLDAMPSANRFDGGDGLNTAVHQWVRGSRSNGSLAIGAGTDTDTDRRQINLKVDHNFNTNHKAAANYSYEWTDADYALSAWPQGHAGYTSRRPVVFTASFTSTLGTNLLNEARFGYRKNQLVIYPAFERPDNEAARNAGLDLLLQGGQGFPISFVPATVGGMNPATYICQTPGIAGGGCAQQGNKSPMSTYADTVSWVRGKHAFKGGAEYRSGYSNGWASPTAPIPQGQGGPGLNPTQAFQNTANFPSMAATNQTLAAQLLYFLSGSADRVQQYYFLQNSKDLSRWENYLTVERKIIDVRQNEFALFFKDDWKMTPSLTWNLGLRYEHFGVPFEVNGLATAPVGGGMAMFGVSGRSFERWLRPNNGVDLSLVTTPEFVGPNTVNPDKTIYRNDWNNWGPAVGFAWEVPWFGQGKTNVRGGYQMTFSGGGRAQPIDNFIFSNPGFQNLALSQGPTDGSYFDMRNVPSFVPVTPGAQPMQPIPVLKFNQNGAAFDYNISTPYVQNFTLSVTREVQRNLTVDVRYIGTRGLKLSASGQSPSYNLNIPNVFYNPALLDAFTRTRRGEDVELLDQIFMGLNLNPGAAGFAPVNGTTQRGSAHLRQSTTFRSALANGDFVALATSLDYFNGTGTGAAGAVPGVAGERGTVLRRANRGFNVPGGTTIAGGPVIPAGLFPENWISANPQFNQANYWSDSGSSIYHSLQVQTTLRPTHGISYQGTYLWSRALGVPLTGYTNPAEREKDYILQANHRTHEFRSHGTFELPIGPNKLLFGNTSGWLARAIERWESSIIFNLATGAPTSVAAQSMLYANGVAELTRDLSLRKGEVRWGDPSSNNQLVGNYFGAGTFAKVTDPQCSTVAANLRTFCTLQAVTDSSGNIVLQNPQPGTRGNIGRQTVENPGSWDFDANIRKTFRISESKSVQIRLDATNILNHPVPNAPTLNINATNQFGFIADKNNAHRQFQAQLRLAF